MLDRATTADLGTWNAKRCLRVVTNVKVEVSTTAAANITRKGGTAVVDLLEPYG
mgnify:FL=1